MTAQVDILVEGAVVITQNKDRDIIYDGSVAIDDGVIVAAGPSAEIRTRYVGRKTLDDAETAVMPGLIDTHHHFLQNFLKGSRDDLALEEWIDRVSAPRIIAAVRDYQEGKHGLQRHATRLGCVEALRSGITCILNMEWATAPEIVDVYEEMGIRAAHTLTLTDVDQWQACGMLLPMTEAMGLADRLIERCRASDLVSFWYGLACPNSCSRELFEIVRGRADDDGSRLHVHIAETEFEWNNIHELHGTTPVGFLHKIGFLGPDVLGAHCIWLSDEDIDTLTQGVRDRGLPQPRVQHEGRGRGRASRQDARERGHRLAGYRQLRGERQHGHVRGDAGGGFSTEGHDDGPGCPSSGGGFRHGYAGRRQSPGP